MASGVMETAIRSFVFKWNENIGKRLKEAVDELRKGTPDGEVDDWRVGTMTTTLLHPSSDQPQRVLVIAIFERWA